MPVESEGKKTQKIAGGRRPRNLLRAPTLGMCLACNPPILGPLSGGTGAAGQHLRCECEFLQDFFDCH